MTDSETRVLARTAAVLLLVSAARYGWELRRGPPVLPEPRDNLAELLAESRRLEEENARRARPPSGPVSASIPTRRPRRSWTGFPGSSPPPPGPSSRRAREGPFARPEDLLRVRGIGPATLERMRPHLAIPARVAAPVIGGAPGPPPAPAAPLDLNRATPAELERLPGIGPELARRILEARAARGSFRSPEELLEVRGIGPAMLERLAPLVSTGGEK